MIAVLENFIDHKECDYLIDFCESKTWSPATVTGQKKYNPSFRRGSTFLIPESHLYQDTCVECITEKIVDAVEAFNQNQYVIAEILFQFGKYNAANQDFFDWHKDDPKSKNPRRVISSTLQLSDRSSYDGGNLEIKNIDLSHYGKSKLKGSLIIFDSQLYHRVTPVSKGVRYSLVTWASTYFK